jgi:hypothetical protein
MIKNVRRIQNSTVPNHSWFRSQYDVDHYGASYRCENGHINYIPHRNIHKDGTVLGFHCSHDIKGIKNNCMTTIDLRLLNYNGSDERCYNPDCDADSKLIKQTHRVMKEMYRYLRFPTSDIDENDLFDQVSDLLFDLEEAL